jgi:hypothetical protein
MAFGIILLVLFCLVALGILIIILGMLVWGIRRLTQKDQPVEKQGTLKTESESHPETSQPTGNNPPGTPSQK